MKIEIIEVKNVVINRVKGGTLSNISSSKPTRNVGKEDSRSSEYMFVKEEG